MKKLEIFIYIVYTHIHIYTYVYSENGKCETIPCQEKKTKMKL